MSDFCFRVVQLDKNKSSNLTVPLKEKKMSFFSITHGSKNISEYSSEKNLYCHKFKSLVNVKVIL